MIKFKGLSIHGNFPQRFSAAQKYIDDTVIEKLEDYTPIANERFKNHGKMSRSHKIETAGVIINTEPKARREYYTNKGFSGANRGKLWLERMKADHKEEIARKAKEKF
jgi:hypothetical protein